MDNIKLIKDVVDTNLHVMVGELLATMDGDVAKKICNKYEDLCRSDYERLSGATPMTLESRKASLEFAATIKRCCGDYFGIKYFFGRY